MKQARRCGLWARLTRVYNARNILEEHCNVGESLWERFTGKRDDTIWYYRTLAKTFREIDPSPLADELGRVVSEL